MTLRQSHEEINVEKRYKCSDTRENYFRVDENFLIDALN